MKSGSKGVLLCLTALFTTVSCLSVTGNSGIPKTEKTSTYSGRQEASTLGIFTNIKASLTYNDATVTATAKNEFTLLSSKIKVFVYLYSSPSYTDDWNNMTLESQNYTEDLNISQTLLATSELAGRSLYWRARVVYQMDSKPWSSIESETYKVDTPDGEGQPVGSTVQTFNKELEEKTPVEEVETPTEEVVVEETETTKKELNLPEEVLAIIPPAILEGMMKPVETKSDEKDIEGKFVTLSTWRCTSGITNNVVVVHSEDENAYFKVETKLGHVYNSKQRYAKELVIKQGDDLRWQLRGNQSEFEEDGDYIVVYAMTEEGCFGYSLIKVVRGDFALDEVASIVKEVEFKDENGNYVYVGEEEVKQMVDEVKAAQEKSALDEKVEETPTEETVAPNGAVYNAVGGFYERECEGVLKLTYHPAISCVYDLELIVQENVDEDIVFTCSAEKGTFTRETGSVVELSAGQGSMWGFDNYIKDKWDDDIYVDVVARKDGEIVGYGVLAFLNENVHSQNAYRVLKFAMIEKTEEGETVSESQIENATKAVKEAFKNKSLEGPFTINEAYENGMFSAGFLKEISYHLYGKVEAMTDGVVEEIAYTPGSWTYELSEPKLEKVKQAYYESHLKEFEESEYTIDDITIVKGVGPFQNYRIVVLSSPFEPQRESVEPYCIGGIMFHEFSNDTSIYIFARKTKI